MIKNNFRYISIVSIVITISVVTTFTEAHDMQCPEGQHWVHAYFRRAYFRADNTFVNAANISAHCHGNPTSYSFVKDRFKGGYPPRWPHRSEKSIKWTEEQRERVMEALSALPPELWDEAIEGVYRLGKSIAFPNPASWGTNTIVLYDEAFNSKKNLSRILAHELAHQKYGSSPRMAQDYRRATGWGFDVDEKTRLIYIKQRKSGYVTEHAKENAAEDFATNVDIFYSIPTNCNQPRRVHIRG